MVEGDHWIFLGLKWGCTKPGVGKIAGVSLLSQGSLLRKVTSMVHRDNDRYDRNLGSRNRLFEVQAVDLCFWGSQMAEAPPVKIKKEDGAPMEMLRKYFDVVHNSVIKQLR